MVLVPLNTQDETDLLKGVLENELKRRVEVRVDVRVEAETPARSANLKQATGPSPCPARFTTMENAARARMHTSTHTRHTHGHTHTHTHTPHVFTCVCVYAQAGVIDQSKREDDKRALECVTQLKRGQVYLEEMPLRDLKLVCTVFGFRV